VSLKKSFDVSEYSIERIKRPNILPIYNRIIYIVNQLVNKKNITSIAFSYADDKRKKIYSAMIENESFKKSLKSIGFHFVGKNNKFYFFDKD
jgi:hypothetical protein